ncbi:MAG: 1-deoxy-D-xylulose-5-phosphate reductoisomerase [Oscillospiraceae bacterium]|jgi:1-deoxy-D-xylulose-5-phosphate reductoisomerase|nr:1-deoxy-D-xylulose-5-phosphate reductoisomerase [Oscillospiraceae bacterium]
MTETISLLGSTGSIGRQTLDVCREQGIRVAALAAGRSVDLLEAQAREFSPRLAVLYDMDAALELANRLKGLDIEVAYGLEGLRRAASLPESGIVVTAMVGMAGLRPTLAAIEAGKRIALANKETLVCAGELVMRAAQEYGADILPVDSEHSAIFQCLQGCRDRGEVKRLILTCSGGPFYGLSREEVASKTRAEALRHPNWTMGEKITIDCASLMNKGLEFIEAMRLFRVTPDQVDVVIHRQSIIHSMVEFRDGTVIAQLGTPDMRLPIRYALTYPRRAASALPALDLLSCPPLTFAPPDLQAFPCLKLAMDCARTGGTSCAVLNGANEAAVDLFRREEIAFGRIPELVENALNSIPVKSNPSLEDILEADRQAREAVYSDK